VTAWGKTVDYVPSIGTEVNVSFDIESREYNGKYYTEVKAFKIETVGKVASQQPSEEFEEPLF